MSDRAAVAVALAAIAGALTGSGPSLWLGAGVAIVAFATRRPALLVLAVFLVAGARSASADAGLRAAGAEGRVDGWVHVLSDPEPYLGGVRADVRLDDGRHAQAEVTGADASARVAAAVQAGDEVRVEGMLRRAPPYATWLAVRHVAVVLRVSAVGDVRDGPLWARAANGVRGVLTRGAASLPARQRSLFLGFVLGDTRGQPVDITDDFRGAGLSHLLAVSGQNVAFALALAGPLLRRVSLRTRLPATLAVIAFFALVTRFEPSVLRASAMAALAVTATTIGRPASSLRLLSLAVGALVLVDPFLVRSVGFQLSVAACLGIVVLAAPLARLLPGPRALADALSVTVAAQAGVAPVLLSTFDGVPVASVPANLLAAPVAGPVMVWGLSAGFVAGLGGGALAALLHWPTRVMIGWIADVAHRAALVPVGELGWRELLAVYAAVGLFVIGRRAGVNALRRAVVAVGCVAVLAPAVALRAPPPLHTSIATGATLWRHDATVLDLTGRTDPGDVLEGLRRAGVARLDLVVARSTSSDASAAVDALRRRYDIGEVITPSSLATARQIVVGQLSIALEPRGRDALVIDIEDGGIARGPPV